MIKTITGPMHSGKTEHMLDIYKKIYNKECIKVFKPLIDTRDFCVMKSKTYQFQVPAIGIERFEDIIDSIDEKTSAIFIDEVHWLKGNVRILSYLSVVKDMDIYLSGLNMTSELEPFLMIQEILAISDEVENVLASCFDCGRKANLTYYAGGKKKITVVGDEGYFPLCNRCYVKRVGKRKLEKLLLKNKE